MPRFVFQTRFGKAAVNVDGGQIENLLDGVSFEPNMVRDLMNMDLLGSYRHFFFTVAQQAAAGIDCGAPSYRAWVFDTLERMEP